MTREELLQVAKPILFNTEMVHAILCGRKTATSRVVKPQQIIGLGCDKCPNNMPEEYIKEKKMLFKPYCDMTDNELISAVYKPPYKPSDVLYVRETWQCWRAKRFESTVDIMFRAGGDGVQLKFANGSTDCIDRFDYDEFVDKWFSHNGEWKPSLFMTKEAARIFLKVKNVRVERLQNITEEQAIKEGTKEIFPPLAVDEFRDIWNAAIKKSNIALYGWDANPFVWVIEFERIEPDCEV